MAKETVTTEPTPAPPIVGLSGDQLAQILQSVGQTNAQAMKQSLRPENDNPVPNSVFHPLGMEKGTLIRETYFCSVKQNEDQLTPGEVADLNAFTENCEARDGTWWAKFERNGTHERLFIHVPSKSIDDRMELPNPRRGSKLTGLQMICRELRGVD